MFTTFKRLLFNSPLDVYWNHYCHNSLPDSLYLVLLSFLCHKCLVFRGGAGGDLAFATNVAHITPPWGEVAEAPSLMPAIPHHPHLLVPRQYFIQDIHWGILSPTSGKKCHSKHPLTTAIHMHMFRFCISAILSVELGSK